MGNNTLFSKYKAYIQTIFAIKFKTLVYKYCCCKKWSRKHYV